jgi:hypothetical protein
MAIATLTAFDKYSSSICKHDFSPIKAANTALHVIKKASNTQFEA